MAGNVGTIPCQFVRGQPEAQKQRTQTFIVAGMSGIGAHRVGRNDSEFTFEVQEAGEEADVDTWIANIQATQGQVVTIEDDWGTQHEFCLITGVTPPRKMPALVPNTSPLEDTMAVITISGVRTST